MTPPPEGDRSARQGQAVVRTIPPDHLPSPGVSCSRTRRTLLLEWWFVSAVRLLWGRRAIVESMARTIIENRVNGIGVAGSEVIINGQNLVITVPGNNGGQAKSLGQTAQLYFRGVVNEVAATAPAAPASPVPATPAPGTAAPATPPTATPPPATPSTATSRKVGCSRPRRRAHRWRRRQPRPHPQ